VDGSTAPDPAVAEAKPTSSEVPQAPEQELIDANDVLKALKTFVQENSKHRVRHVLGYCVYFY